MKQSKFEKKYKVLMLDVDGTIIKLDPGKILPSESVTTAINKAAQKIHVGIVTARPIAHVSHVIEHLNLSSPCILTGGSVVYDPVRKKIAWRKIIPKNIIKEVYKVTKMYNVNIMDDGRGLASPLEEKDIKKPTQLWLKEVNLKIIDEVFEKLSNISNISVQKSKSRFIKNGIDILVAHPEATKQHGILKVAEILGIETHDIIGVGDGYNDFPLLMACGLKVAMGNAVAELKEIADYIAPSVEEDGVSDVIERFVLNEKFN